MGPDTIEKSAAYARRIDDIRSVSLTIAEIAEISGVKERQVYHWINGEHPPRGRSKDRLLDLHYVVEQLKDVYRPEGVDIWLHGRNKNLNGKRPIDLLRAGDFEYALDEIERLKSGAM